MFICQLLQNEFGSTPLYAACLVGHLDVATVLVQNGADVNFENRVRLFYCSVGPNACRSIIGSLSRQRLAWLGREESNYMD